MIFRGSRYTNTPTYQIQKGWNPVFDMREYFEFSPQNIQWHTWMRQDKFSALAKKYFGSATLWWVFLEANGSISSEMSLNPGDRLRVPNIREILSYVNDRGGY